MSQNILPTKRPSSSLSRPNTAGLAPSGKLVAEKEVDAIEATVRAKLAAAAHDEDEGEKPEVPAHGPMPR